MSSSMVPIAQTGVQLTARGAYVPDDITYENAEQAVHGLSRLGGSVRWAIADVLATSEGKWGEKYAQMVDLTQMSIGGVMNMMRVWRKFPTPESRMWDLSFSHYAAVARDYLDIDDIHSILQQAEDEGLSRDEVREIVKGYGPNIITPVFSREAFIIRVQSLIDWAVDNDAPKELVDAVVMLFGEFKESK